MDLLQLETFVQLVQQRSFSRAAKDLGVSQPTVTVRIKALEDELGTPLILRVGNKVELTAAGQSFYEGIERSLRVLKEGIDQCAGDRTANKARLSIAGTPNLCAFVIPRLLGDVYHAHPDWELNLLTARSWEVSEMVLDEVCHIGFLNGYFQHPEIVTLPLFKDPFYLIAHPEHPLCLRDSISLYDLREESLFTYKLDSNMSYMIKSLFRDIKQRTDLTMELSDSYTMKRMIMERIGIGFMPWSAAEPDVRSGRLAVLPLQLPIPLTREVNVIVLKKNIGLLQISEWINVMYNKYGSQSDNTSDFLIRL